MEIIAIPSEAPGGLEAQASPHFGRAPFYTLVEIENGRPGAVKAMMNGGHEAGGCLGPVNFLAAMGVTAIVAGGMGQRPLFGFLEKNITVYRRGDQAASVADLLSAYQDGRLMPFRPENACGGGCSH